MFLWSKFLFLFFWYNHSPPTCLQSRNKWQSCFVLWIFFSPSLVAASLAGNLWDFFSRLFINFISRESQEEEKSISISVLMSIKQREARSLRESRAKRSSSWRKRRGRQNEDYWWNKGDRTRKKKNFISENIGLCAITIFTSIWECRQQYRKHFYSHFDGIF